MAWCNEHDCPESICDEFVHGITERQEKDMLVKELNTLKKRVQDLETKIGWNDPSF